MLAMLLFATIALQLDVGGAGCADCVQLSESEHETQLNQTQTISATSHDSSAAQSLYAKSNDSSFPAWIKAALGIAVVALGLILASRTVLRKLFIFKTKNRKHGGAKASHSPDYHRDAWKAKRAHRKNPHWLC